MRQFFVCVLIFSMMTSMLLAQTNWERYGTTPVLEVGPSGSWDDDDLLVSMILEVEDTLRMWYSGAEDNNNHYAIGYAWSIDGITWTKWANNPVLELGIDGSWDASSVNFPRVLYQDGEYIMYYGANGNAYPYDRWKVGIARSSDPVNWIKDINNPVFEGSADGSWDDKYVLPFAIEFDGTEYTMWYNGRQASGHYQVGRAISTDGVTNWVRDTGNPLIPNGPYGSWDYWELIGSSICHVGDLVEIFYTGAGGGGQWRIGMATSSDGNNFTKYPGNPLFAETAVNTWDESLVAYPAVTYDPSLNSFRIWYTGDDGYHAQIGYATAPLDATVSIEDEEITLAESVILNQNYPNPFNPTTTISFALPEKSSVKLTVFDIRGQEVMTLLEAEKPPGTYCGKWNGLDQSGNPVKTGVYFARLQAGEYSQTIKMLYLK